MGFYAFYAMIENGSEGQPHTEMKTTYQQLLLHSDHIDFLAKTLLSVVRSLCMLSYKERLPSSIQCQGNLKVGEDGPEEGFNETDGESDEGRWQNERPGWEEQVVPLLEEDWHTIDGKRPAGASISECHVR